MRAPDLSPAAAVLRVELHDRQTRPVPATALEAGARWAVHLAGGGLDCLSLALVDEERITRLNRQLLGRSGPTDVIAFEAEPDETGRGAEVILCVPVAQRQAAERGHGLDRELAVRAAHGALHALGYRDDTPAARRRMSRLQERAADLALAAAAVPNPCRGTLDA